MVKLIDDVSSLSASIATKILVFLMFVELAYTHQIRDLSECNIVTWLAMQAYQYKLKILTYENRYLLLSVFCVLNKILLLIKIIAVLIFIVKYL